MKSKIKKILRTIIAEEEFIDNKVIFTNDEFEEILPFYNWNVLNIENDRDYKGKEIIISGDLNLSHTPTKNLGTITVKGKLDVSNTQISTLDGVTVSGYICKNNTPLQKRLDDIEFQKKLRAQEVMRERGDWDTDGSLDDLGKCANALFKHLIQTEYEEKEPGDQEILTQLYAEKERREEIEAETEDDENLSELNSINAEIEEIEKRIDVYDLIPDGRYHRLYGFKVATPEGLSESLYYVGDEYDTESSAIEYVKDSFDGGIEHAVSDWVIRDNIDEEELKDWFREGEYDNVRENLDSYFDEDDFEYSEDVQNRIDEIEEKLENPEELSQEEFDELNEELEDLRDSDKDIPEHMIDDKVEELLDEMASDPIDTIRNYGLDISNFIDEDAVAKQVVRDDGYGTVLNYYDGTEDSVEFEDDIYYIFEIN